MHKIIIIILFCLPIFGKSQEKYFSSPLKIPLFLSGSFAEIRSNHFHSGMDLKTQGVTGQAVSAAAKGYISRISVSPTGFGNALYINHPNGTTTVYGHLFKFRDDIQQYVKKIQYEQKSFAIDIQLLPTMFKVEKDDWIAISGNTGSSGGPHLHFEIRDTQTEEALNPLDFGFSITDKTPPTISGLQIVPLSESSTVESKTNKKIFPVVFYEGKFHLVNNPVIPVTGEIGFAFEAYDYFDGSLNKCGLSKIRLKIDGELYFSMNLHQFTFDETRYINSFIDYEDLIAQNRKFQKTYVDPGNQLKMYDFNKNRGVFLANDYQTHLVEIEAEDAYGNLSVLTFKVNSEYKEPINEQSNTGDYFEWNQSNYFVTDDIELYIPSGNLFKTIKFDYQKFPTDKGYISDIHQIISNTVPLLGGAELKIKPTNLDESLFDKAILVIIDPISGKYSAAGGKYENGWVNSEIKVLGNYAIRVDTIAPVIKSISIKNKNTLTETNRIQFTISDDLSGINTIVGYIDDKWALFEYDQKNNLITHYFDTERFEMNIQHYLKLIISDYKNNIAIYEAAFVK